MPSNLILTFQTKADISGADALAKAMEEMKKKMQDTAKSSASVGQSFGNLKSILTGTILASPLAGFIKEAMQSEEVSARMGMQFKALGQSIDDIDFDKVSKQVRDLAGITQTELAQALTTGIKYFKDSKLELQYLNTAIGMTKISGVNLSTAFQQLGYVMQYGAGRAVRQYGVSLHTDIHDPTQRGIAILKDMQKAMEPLAKQTGTTAEALKIMGASIKDLGENIGSNFLIPIANIAKTFNHLNDSTKELTIGATLLGAAFAVGFGDLALLVAMILPVLKLAKETQSAIVNAEKAEDSYYKLVISAMRARASDATTALGQETKFADKIKETETVYKNLITQQTLFRLNGDKVTEGAAAKQAAAVSILLEGQKKEADELAKHNVTTLDQYQKFQYKMAELRVMAMKDGNDKDLAEFNLKMAKEKDAMIKAYGSEMDVRLALAKSEAAQEAEVWKKAIDKEMDYALLSNEERMKYDQDYQDAHSRLAGMSFEGFKQSEDALKELVKTSGGKKALEEQTLAWGEQKAAISSAEMEQRLYRETAGDIAQLYQNNRAKGIEWLNKEAEAIRDKKRAELEEQESGIKNLKSFTSEEKTINTKAELNVNTTVNITPNLSELGKAAGDAVKKAVDSNAKQIEDNIKMRLSGSGGGF